MIHDGKGNKIPQPRISKKEFAKNVRMKRTQGSLADGRVPGLGDYCPDCGFKIRSINHEEGMHHKDTVPRCSR